MDTMGTRINKYLSEAGVCSRREADRLVDAKEVLVDDQLAEKGTRVFPGQKVYVKGKLVSTEDQNVLLLVNKAKGIVCTTAKDEGMNIVDYVNFPVRVYPIGRLDKDSHGLILMTNQGDLVNKMMRAGNYHEKEYVVRVDKEVTEEFIHKMSRGIYLRELEQKTRPCKVKKLSYDTFKIILTQGLNRQIRRMCEACNYRVRDLKRVRIMNLTLDGIPEGQYREIKPEEYKELEKLLRHSTSTPKKVPGYKKPNKNGRMKTNKYKAK
jgi:23S rRNA pseudouridine2604 synthase